MSPRATRWLLFGALVVALPLPLLGPFGGTVPPLRSAILFGATALVALTEGAAGPVLGILGLFAVNVALGLALAGGLAWGATRLLAGLGDGARGAVVLGAVAVLLVAASSFEIYETSFGRFPRVSLLGILW